MATSLSPRQTVNHPQYGQGVVLCLNELGNQTFVHFKLIDGGKWVLTADLTSREVEARAAAETTPPSRKQLIPAEEEKSQLERRLILECLRQGLPPPRNIRQWTVGFKDVQQEIKTALKHAMDSGKGSVLIIEANYGSGKTHVGQLARAISQELGFLVMQVELDGTAVTLREGVRLLSRLFASAHVPVNHDDSAGVPGLGTLLKQAAFTSRGRFPVSCKFFDSFLKISEEWVGNEEAVELLERYLAGDGNRLDIEQQLSSLVGQRLDLPALKVNWGRMEDRIAAQANQLERIIDLGQVAGSKGALIVMDEFDHELRYSDELDYRSRRVLESFCNLSRKVPLVMLLLVPSNHTMGLPNCRLLRLPELTVSELRQLTLRTLDAYLEAFPDKQINGNRDTLFRKLLHRYKSDYSDRGWGPRFFVRAIIEVCDLSTHRQVNLDEIEV